jgi:hypothetical protein
LGDDQAADEMIDAILSGLGGPREPFPWIGVLILVG